MVGSDPLSPRRGERVRVRGARDGADYRSARNSLTPALSLRERGPDRAASQ